ncbi:MAG: hypothetical protein JWO86_5439 [Myxococcaceae bacterium]|nr:hypothetical protein [Myxococcaceae bacterium]
MSRSRSLRSSFFVLQAGAVALVIAACSSSSRGFDTPPGPSFVAPGADASAPEAPAPTCGPHCSRDLKTVLTGCDGAEQVAETCTADQGCGQGQCVPACTAAELSKGSAGCEFWTLPVDDVQEGPGSCFAAIVANTWDRAVALTADYGSKPLDISKSAYTVDRKDGGAGYTLLEGPLPPGQVAIVFLAQSPNVLDVRGTPCPPAVTPALLADPILHGTSRTTAFHLKADAPVSAYSIFPYGGANTHFPSATLLLPVSSWEKDYVAVSPHDFGFHARRTLQIVADQDDTVVSIRPNVEVPSGSNIDGATSGVTKDWTLARGQVLQFTQDEMTGSPISTTKPVGVFGGSECTYVPAAYGTCDLLQQQIPPTSQWGTKYALVPFPPRIDSFSSATREQVPYTIVGAADGTVLTYEPSRPQGAPETLDAAQSASFMTDQLLVVRSQDSKHPFHAAVYMTGSTFGGGTGTFVTGDPDYVNVPPADQFLDRYVFFTDYTYPETRLTVVRRKTVNGFLPVELDCAAGPIDGFAPLGTSGEFEYAWVSLTNGYVPQKIGKGECGYGRQGAHSDGPFAITVWGMSQDSSYGYVGGTGLRPINDAPPPLLK